MGSYKEVSSQGIQQPSFVSWTAGFTQGPLQPTDPYVEATRKLGVDAGTCEVVELTSTNVYFSPVESKVIRGGTLYVFKAKVLYAAECDKMNELYTSAAATGRSLDRFIEHCRGFTSIFLRL